MRHNEREFNETRQLLNRFSKTHKIAKGTSDNYMREK